MSQPPSLPKTAPRRVGAGLAVIAGMKNLKRLNLANTAVTDAAADSLASLENLEYLNLVGTKVTDAAMPKLATGVGGLDWRDVHPLVVQHLGDLPIPIYIYTSYHKGQQASEPDA